MAKKAKVEDKPVAKPVEVVKEEVKAVAFTASSVITVKKPLGLSINR